MKIFTIDRKVRISSGSASSALLTLLELRTEVNVGAYQYLDRSTKSMWSLRNNHKMFKFNLSGVLLSVPEKIWVWTFQCTWVMRRSSMLMRVLHFFLTHLQHSKSTYLPLYAPSFTSILFPYSKISWIHFNFANMSFFSSWKSLSTFGW